MASLVGDSALRRYLAAEWPSLRLMLCEPSPDLDGWVIAIGDPVIGDGASYEIHGTTGETIWSTAYAVLYEIMWRRRNEVEDG